MDALQLAVKRAHFAKRTPQSVREPPAVLVATADHYPVAEVIEIVKASEPVEETKPVEEEVDEITALTRRFDDLQAKLSKVMHMVGADEVTGIVHGPRYLVAGDIRKAVCEYFEMTMHDLDGPSRAIAFARVRQIAIYLCHKHTLRSMPHIGRIFGGRDHTTILHSIRRIDELRKLDPVIDTDLRNLESRLAETLENRQVA